MKIFGIYHANGGLFGEISYLFCKLTFRHSCSFCSVTHRGLKIKSDWVKYVNRLDVSFKLLHLNEQTAEMAAYTKDKTPCIIASVNGVYLTLMDSKTIENCDGNVENFSKLLDRSISKFVADM